MSDKVIHDALVLAITDAFFNQKQFYNQPTNSFVYYGGDCKQLVKEILNSDFMTEVKNEFTKAIEERKPELLQKAYAQFDDIIATHANSQLIENSYDVRQFLRIKFDSYARDTFGQMLENDENLKAKLQAMVPESLENYDIQFTVNVTVTSKPKPEETKS